MTADGTLVVFDTEYTAWEGSNARGWSRPGEHREIVQIGAVKLAREPGLGEVDTFDLLVRPRINPRLSDYFIALTGITQADVESRGLPFAEALDAFAAFVDDTVGAVFSFGNDQWVVAENCRLNGIPYPLDDGLFRNVGPPLMEAVGRPALSSVSSDLPDLFGFQTPGTKHQALDDARCIAQAMRILQDRGHTW